MTSWTQHEPWYRYKILSSSSVRGIFCYQLRLFWRQTNFSNSLESISLLLSKLTEDDPKTPFSIATTLRCRRGCYFFPWIAPLTLDPCFIMLSVKQRSIFFFLVFDMTRPRIERRSHRLLANTFTG